MEHKKIVLLAGKGESTTIVFNSINQNFGVIELLLKKENLQKYFLKEECEDLA